MRIAHRRQPRLLGLLGLLWLCAAALLLRPSTANTIDGHEGLVSPAVGPLDPPDSAPPPGRGIRPPWREHWIPELRRSGPPSTPSRLTQRDARPTDRSV